MINDNIRDFMNAFGKKEYTTYHVCAIESAIRIEAEIRKLDPNYKKIRTKEGRRKINFAAAKICTKNGFVTTAHDVWLYKRCRAREYEDRTGKCAWGFKDVRKRMGYDPQTGKEIV